MNIGGSFPVYTFAKVNDVSGQPSPAMELVLRELQGWTLGCS